MLKKIVLNLFKSIIKFMKIFLQYYEPSSFWHVIGQSIFKRYVCISNGNQFLLSMSKISMLSSSYCVYKVLFVLAYFCRGSTNANEMEAI